MKTEDKRNIVLIGMPGCGKSSVGRELSRISGRLFYDCDEEIEKSAGLSIQEIFSLYGESKFRELEHSVLMELLKGEEKIIATGGGAVKSAVNRNAIKQKSRAVWIKRDIKALPRDGRPLSVSADLDEMYKERAPLYENTADISVTNNTTVAEAAMQCAKELEI